jgi:hypothetical protein
MFFGGNSKMELARVVAHESEDPIIDHLVSIGEVIARDNNLRIKNVVISREALNSESVVNIDFLVCDISPLRLAELNFYLSQALSKDEIYRQSEIEYIPSFCFYEEE